MAANDINSVVLVGNLTRDAEISYLQTGTPVAALSIAVNRAKKNGDQWTSEVSYFDVSYFGKAVEGLKQYLVKGKKIGVTGILKQDRWEKDGQKFSRIRILAQSIQLLSSNENNGSGNSSGYQQQNSGHVQQQKPAQNNDYQEQDGEEFPEDIPF